MPGQLLYLTHALFPADTMTRRRVRQATLVVVGVAALGVSAQLRIPFYPVPFTMQTFIVLVTGLTYGPGLAASTIGAYLGLGSIGVPLFAGSEGGLEHLVGPTAGYLWGFLLAAWLVGCMERRGRSRTWQGTLVAMAVGTVVIFACGLAWLTHLYGLRLAFATGLLPFLGSETAKVGLAMVTVPRLWQRFGLADPER